MIQLPPLDGQGPLYRQLARALAAAVRRGGAGDRLPATRELADWLQLSRNTVRAAYDLLQAQGLLASRPGAGNFAVAAAARESGAPRRQVYPAASAFARRSRAGVRTARQLRQLQESMRFNLQYGEPLTDVRFGEVWRRELGRAAVHASLRYTDPQGVPALREALVPYLRRHRSISVHPEDLLIVSGTQQAVALLARVLVDERDGAVVENPGYFFTRELLQAQGARLSAVDVDRHGLRVDQLPARGARLVCTTPSHQFPLGMVMSPERRQALLAYAKKHEAWVLEDDYDAAFRFDARMVEPLYSDAEGRVIHVGSFSKMLSPALRLGYVVMPRPLRNDLITAKRLADLGGAEIDQVALANFLNSGAFERHLARSMQSLRLRRETLLAGLARHAGGQLSVTDSGAGMHVVARLQRGSLRREGALVDAGRQIGLGLHPLSIHYARSAKKFGLLLGYAGLAPVQLHAACELLGQCLGAASLPGASSRAS